MAVRDYLATRMIVVLTFLFLTLIGSVNARDSEVGRFPLSLAPSRLAKKLDEPARSLHLIMAESLAQAQQQALCEFNNQDCSDLGDSIFGFALAAEEYFVLELTYPDSVARLLESGYLLPDWFYCGIKVVDYDDYNPGSQELQIVYIPQPIGLVDLSCIPGMPCVHRMRNYREYSLAIQIEDAKQLFSEPPGIKTHWFKPFYDAGLLEILHMDHVDEVLTRCATCNVP